MANRIFLLRHAEKEKGGGDLGLSFFGKEQSKMLAQKLKTEIVSSQNIVIMTSPALRAKETAKIIHSVLLSEFDVQDIIVEEKLWSDDFHPHDFMWLKDKILNFEGDNLIVVTHLEYVNKFPLILGYNVNYAPGVMIKNGVCDSFYC